ncbi:hypothetical protein [Streptomyces sp. SID3343]|uniref:hypothetical protein n=1 Tax=Streptomyces sp. SID3343 TaxID=2690260 RepID=UPI00136ABF7A|nr:hypothetical protein [Streptomyces sp. SID3343]MYW03325.1 hypothetical protein [Streptomyces sp. SID3343]MYW04720.1 hypothetical protein [Streptomyces sp. SID3343]
MPKRPKSAHRVRVQRGSGSAAAGARDPGPGDERGSDREPATADDAVALVEQAYALTAGERDSAPEQPSFGDDVDIDDVAEEVGVDDLRAAVEQALRARELARRREQEHREEIRRLERARNDLAEQEERREVAHRARVEGVAADEDALRARASRIDEREAELVERIRRCAADEARLFELEQQAHTDFAEYRRDRIAGLREELARLRTAADAETRRRDEEIADRRGAAETEFHSRSARLDAAEARIEERERSHERRERLLDAREQEVESERVDVRRQAEASVALEFETCRLERDAWRDRHRQAVEIAQERGRQLAALDAAALDFEGRSIPEVAAELRRLRADHRELRHTLAARPPEDQERLRELELRHQEWVAEREELLRQNEEHRRLLASGRIAVAERETNRVVNQALEGLNNVLRTEIAQQAARYGELQADPEHRSAFPACTALDERAGFAEQPQLSAKVPDLAALAVRIREDIARRKGLFYSERDLRCFLGGLAASRLHLLEGISGIGKTALPLEFAKAIGAGSATVAVAAEWRGPQDLMGYYNAFERKFYESEFTQALYRAQLPAFRTRPFLVVLDEMNLSHPEQYFSDVLHALEMRARGPQILPLTTSEVGPAPRLLHEGRALVLPDNVWFIGTANNDETTVTFADKTYDRAHVLELPDRPVSFCPPRAGPIAPLSMEALSKAFADARERYHQDAETVLAFLDDELGNVLRRDLQVSWGSRLPRQAREFVPVVRACGGDIGEAADHLLTTRILRKVRGRREVAAPRLEKIQAEIEQAWPRLSTTSVPTDALEFLENEIRDRGVW